VALKRSASLSNATLPHSNPASRLSTSTPLPKTVPLTSTDTLKIILTTQDGSTAKRAHQAFLTLTDPTTTLEISYPFSVKDSGKAKLDLTHKDIPTAFLRSPRSLSASIVIASFGSSPGYNSKVFTLAIESDSTASSAGGDEKPLRYGKLPEIHHIFRADPKNPNIMISLFFSGVVVATLPILLGTVRPRPLPLLPHQYFLC
jgi:oligosaccharyltransferase complex subunit delta (ribophorin II)